MLSQQGRGGALSSSGFSYVLHRMCTILFVPSTTEHRLNSIARLWKLADTGYVREGSLSCILVGTERIPSLSPPSTPTSSLVHAPRGQTRFCDLSGSAMRSDVKASGAAEATRFVKVRGEEGGGYICQGKQKTTTGRKSRC
ncbi:unnamed protein product [Protopolystoma xenopodis]|uniref:Uncharacterized protein n=1 Tax=Protopolystoma xenopodis TaxID=117903 RepID=A0A448W9Y0_9PLAT|nr:unnamed protein product [Protopolystoma xenopodis]